MKYLNNEVLGLSFIILITLIVFSPVFSAGFVNWDDGIYIYNNPALVEFDWRDPFTGLKRIFSQKLTGIYTPLTTLSFLIDSSIHGLDHPQLWHIDNVLLHIIVVIISFFITKRLGLSLYAAFIVSLLVAIHPMRVESVAWITERKDVLYGIFYFSAIYYYLKNRHRKLAFQSFTIWLLFILALLVKVLAVTLPLSLILIDFYKDKKFDKKRIFGVIPLIIFSFMFGLIGLAIASDENYLSHPDSLMGWINNFAISSYALLAYIVKSIYPYVMLPVYPYPDTAGWHHFTSLLIPVGLLIMLYQAYVKNYRYIFFGLAFFLVNIVFTLQVVPVGQGYMADRYTYIPYFGLFFVLAYFFDNYVVNRYKSKVAYCFLPLILICGFSTFQQSKIWHDSLTLWNHQLKYIQNTWAAHKNLGQYYGDNGNGQKQLYHLNRAIELKPDDHGSLNEIGLYYSKFNDLESNNRALDNYNRAIELDSSFSGVFVNRGVVKGRLGHPEEALKDLNKALLLNPDHADGWLNQAVLFNTLQEYQEAITSLNSYLELQANAADKWIIKGQLHMRLEQMNEALISFSRGVEIRPDIGLYYFERALCYYEMGLMDEAKKDINKSSSLGYNDRSEIADDILSR